MTTHSLRPWTDLVKLHPDVESGNLTEAVFAVDLGASPPAKERYLTTEGSRE